MKVEVIIHKITHGHNVERTLVDHFCLVDESDKRPTRKRIKKLLRRTFPRIFRWITFVHKDNLGHYHVTESGRRANASYHFWWYHFEIIPCSTKMNDSATIVTDTPSTCAETPITNEILRGITKNVYHATGVAGV